VVKGGSSEAEGSLGRVGEVLDSPYMQLQGVLIGDWKYFARR
jgi:hypothetical protein